MVASLYLLSTLLYLTTNRLPHNARRAVVLKWPIDDKLPFMPVFILPYCAWFVFIAAVFFWLIFDRRQKRHIYRHTAAILIAMLISTIIFILYPTHVPRPAVEENDFFSRLVLAIYSADEPYNCFPSLHVAVAVISGITLYRYGPKRIGFRVLTAILIFLIALSTVLTKQHYTPDVIGGLILALVCDGLSGVLLPKRILEDEVIL